MHRRGAALVHHRHGEFERHDAGNRSQQSAGAIAVL